MSPEPRRLLRAASRAGHGLLPAGPDEGPRQGASSSCPEARSAALVRWAGRLIVVYGTAHTLGALTAEGAAHHAGTWFRGRLWREDLSDMSPAMSAYWLSVNSFGPPLTLIGLTVLWLERRGVTPPPFLAWSLAGWLALGVVVTGPGVGQDLILLVAAGLLVAATRRALSPGGPRPAEPGPAGRLAS